MESHGNRQRWVLRSIAAFIVSFLTVIVLSLGTDAILRGFGVFPPLDQPMNDSRLLAVALGYRVVYGVLGGYVIARLAPFAPMAHAVISGLIGLAVSTLGAVAMWGFGPGWYPVGLAATALPCAWLGGRLEQAHSARA